nr:MAK10-like protein [Tanacetum cinerariifolium]
MGDANPIRTLEDYSKPSHEGYMNTIELPVGNNVVPLRSDIIWLVQNGCSFHGLRDRKLCRWRLAKETQCKKAWATIEDLARYEDDGWNDLITPREGSLEYKNLSIEQLLGVMECKVNTLIKEAISLMGRSKSVTTTLRTISTRGIRESCYREIKGRNKDGKNNVKKIKKITRYLVPKDLEPFNECKFSETLTKKASFHTPKSVSPKSVCVKHVHTIFPSPPLVRESTFGFKPGTRNNRNIKSRHDVENSDPQSTPQVLPSFKEYTSLVTYPEEVKETLGISMEVEPLDEPQLEDLGLNTCNHNITLSSMEIPNVDEPEPQLLPNSSPLDVILGDKRGTDPPINPCIPGSFRKKVVDPLTINTPPLPPCGILSPRFRRPQETL